ncbi:MAG: pyridoxal-phosphate dependent enzyme [Bacilli bacterium]|jgi:cysteine synthase A|nr:pyridoxal-phosphate dependent enzyme [Bacilli bacterium]NLN80229.1 pyridoxal-phosphate dependent enzyme [Erysipelotrichia bacterium]
MIYNHLDQLIGNTPILEVQGKNNNKLFLKLEMFNPGGSIKDRIALEMINDLIRKDLLLANKKVVEATSGNTGIALSMLLGRLGYSFTAVMPENMSMQRRQLFKAYGAEVILTPASLGMDGAIDKAKQLANQGYLYVDQFNNIANVNAHLKTTSEEIKKDFDKLDYIVLGVGTGGTLTGLSLGLKDKFPKIKFIAVEPKESSVLSGNPKGPHLIQGIGAGFIPPLLHLDAISEIITIPSGLALAKAKKLAMSGLFLGPSSAAAYLAAEKLMKKVRNATILVIAPDGGNKYL